MKKSISRFFLISILLSLVVGFVYLGCNYIPSPDGTWPSKIDTSVNYEDELFTTANNYWYEKDFYMTSVEREPFDCDEVITVNTTFYPYPIEYVWIDSNFGEGAHPEITENDIVLEEFTFREKQNIKSAREHVIKYIQDSKVLVDKEYLITEIENVQFYKYSYLNPDLGYYTDRTIHNTHAVYYPEYIETSFSEYVACHELVHHLSHLTTTSKNISEKYYASHFAEGLTDLITYSMMPNMPYNEYSNYGVYYSFIYDYLAIFGRDALTAHFYGYSDFFEKYGGTTFADEHDAFILALELLDFDYSYSAISADSITQTWMTRTA